MSLIRKEEKGHIHLQHINSYSIKFPNNFKKTYRGRYYVFLHKKSYKIQTKNQFFFREKQWGRKIIQF